MKNKILQLNIPKFSINDNPLSLDDLKHWKKVYKGRCFLEILLSITGITAMVLTAPLHASFSQFGAMSFFMTGISMYLAGACFIIDHDSKRYSNLKPINPDDCEEILEYKKEFPELNSFISKITNMREIYIIDLLEIRSFADKKHLAAKQISNKEKCSLLYST